MRLLIVIVNYRTPALTIDALASIADEARTIPARVIITDNLSGDDSVQRISAEIVSRGYSDFASLVALPKNGGFAYGNNEGIRPYLESSDPPDYVLLLNPDTVVRPGAIRTLIDYLQANISVGLAGSRLEDPDGTPQRSAFRFHSLASEFESGLRLGIVSKLLQRHVVAPPVPASAGPCDWVAGASLLVKREVFDRIGLLDDGFFMYFEEVDFCLRARRAGFACHYVPASRVVHLVGQASGVTDKKRANKRRPGYWFDARRRYYVKNHGRLYAMLADLLHASAFALWRVRRIIQRKPDLDPDRFLLDFIRHASWFNR